MNNKVIPWWGAILTALALAAANFAYQRWLSGSPPDYGRAWDRTWFQATALLVAWLTW
jgi:hypothetical protein